MAIALACLLALSLTLSANHDFVLLTKICYVIIWLVSPFTKKILFRIDYKKEFEDVRILSAKWS